VPGFTVTRGLGPGATPSNLIARGFLPDAAAKIVRGTKRKTKKHLDTFLEELKVTMSLIAINGKDIVKPIINAMRTSYKDEPAPRIEVTPIKLAVRQPDIKVSVIRVRSKNNVDD
jgi:hypothetical protein